MMHVQREGRVKGCTAEGLRLGLFMSDIDILALFFLWLFPLLFCILPPIRKSHVNRTNGISFSAINY